MGFQIMGTGHLQPREQAKADFPAPATEFGEDRIRRIARDEMRKMLDEMAEEAMQHLKEL